MTYTISCIAGGILAGWVARSQFEKRLRGGNMRRNPLVMNEGRTIRGNGNGGPTTPKPGIPSKPQPAGGRLYEGAFYRMKGSDIWYPVGTEPDWSELARDQVRRRGSNPPPPGRKPAPPVGPPEQPLAARSHDQPFQPGTITGAWGCLRLFPQTSSEDSTMTSYKLLQLLDGTYQLILVDSSGEEHPQPTLIEKAPVNDAEEVKG